MKKYWFISIGGFLGAILRYVIKTVGFSALKSSFPLDTFVINICGAFLLAAVLAFTNRYRECSTDRQLGITVGFCGAFTTFSTLCKEISALISNGSYTQAVFYAALSTAAGLAAAYCGELAGRKTAKLVRSKVKTAEESGAE